MHNTKKIESVLVYVSLGLSPLIIGLGVLLLYLKLFEFIISFVSHNPILD